MFMQFDAHFTSYQSIPDVISIPRHPQFYSILLKNVVNIDKIYLLSADT